MSTSEYVGPELTTMPEVRRIVRRAQYDAFKAIERDCEAIGWCNLTEVPALLERVAGELGIPWPEMKS